MYRQYKKLALDKPAVKLLVRLIVCRSCDKRWRKNSKEAICCQRNEQIFGQKAVIITY